MDYFSSFAIGGFVPSAAIAGVLLLVGLGAFFYLGIKGPTDYWSWVLWTNGYFNFHNLPKKVNTMDLTTILFILSFPFVLLTVYFGTKNDFYESENYKGDGCAHDVKR